MRILLLAGAALGLALMSGGDASGQAPAGLEPGDSAPPFSLPGSDGKTHRLEDYRGRAVVLAWFPMAFTGG
jgi:thioredoxin-dependent peroxiredoxin